MFSDSLDTLKEWGIIGLLKRCIWRECGKSLSSSAMEEIDCDIANDCLKKRGLNVVQEMNIL